jgi:hypothetical protein
LLFVGTGGIAVQTVRSQEAGSAGESAWESSVVTVDVTRKQYDYQQPWSKRTRNVQKAGLVVRPTEVLTTAEDLSDRTLVRLQKGGRGTWWPAEVKWIDYHANLALVSAREDAFWQGLRPVPLARPARVKQPLQVVRWRNGKLENRKAEFTQFVVDNGKLSFVPHLQFELSSDIAAAGWGEPVVNGGEAVGIVFAHGGSTLSVIVSTFIDSILEAQAQRRYTGLGYFPFVWQPGENPATLKRLGLEGLPRGVVITESGPAAAASTPLKPLDLILKVDGFDIDVEGDYLDPDYGHLMLENLATRGKWASNDVQLTVWRDGRAVDISYRLPKVEYGARLVPEWLFDQEPEYLIAGGLVFQPLSNPYLRSWGDDWKRRAPFRLFHYNNEEPTAERAARVLLSLVLPDPFTLGYEENRYLVVDRANGQPVSRLSDLRAALAQPQDGFHVIDFVRGDSLQRVVIDAAQLEPATQRVLQRYGIPQSQRIHAGSSGDGAPP